MSEAVDPVIGNAMCLALLFLFVSAAVHKLRDFPAFRTAVAGYQLAPAAASGAIAALLVVAEIATAVALLIGRVGGLAAMALLSLYTAAIGINVARGRLQIDCGCGGPGARQTLSGALVDRNLLLLAGAMIAALPVAPRPLVWLDVFTMVAAAVLLALVYAAVDTALSNAAHLRRAAV